MSANRPELFSLSGLVRLARVQNLVIVVFAQYFTAIYLIRPYDNWEFYLQDINLFLLSLSTVLIGAAGYVINDYYDIKIDYINKPDEVIVGKVLTRRSVMAIHSLMNIMGIILGFIISIEIAALNFFSAFLLWFYSNQLKRMPLIGNLVVGLLTALVIVIVAIYYQHSETAVFLYAFFAFTITLIREIIKDIEDIVGDEKFGSKTLPIIWGIRKTKRFIYAICILFLITMGFLILTGKFPVNTPLLLIIIAPVAVLGYLLFRADTKSQFSRLSSFTKFFILLGILSMILIK